MLLRLEIGNQAPHIAQNPASTTNQLPLLRLSAAGTGRGLMGGTGQSGGTSHTGVRRHTPLVGRGKLLEQSRTLIAEWLALRHDLPNAAPAGGAERIAARNRLLLVRGPAAVGKSRFAYELVKRLVEETNANTATAHCVENGSLTAFAAEIVQVAGVGQTNLPDRWEQLCSGAAQLAGTDYAERTRRHLPLLALLLDCPAVDTASIRRADAGSFIHGVKQALRACCELTAYCSARPLVLVIEDLQWLGHLREVTADLLQYTSLPQPLIVIGTARPEFEATTAELDKLAGPSAYKTLDLPPLAQTEGGQLIRELLPDVELPPQLALELESKAEGIPYYYEEFARLALAQGLVVERDGKLALNECAAEIALPADIRELILNRLQQLEPQLLDLTGRAAVIGRSFSGERLRMLQAALGANAAQELAAGLAALQRQQFVTGEAGDRYFFEHVLTQDAAYASLSSESRAELHHTMAEILDGMLISGTASEWDILPELIRHLESSARYQEAHARTCEVLKLMADTGRHEGWEEWLAKAMRTWEAHSQTTSQVEAPGHQALSLEAPPSDYPASASLHLAACELHRRRGRYALAREHASVALELASRESEQALLAHILLSLGRVHLDLGQLLEARQRYEQALDHARESGDRLTEGRALNRLGVVHCVQGRVEQAQGCYEEALAIAREFNNRLAESSTLHNLAVLAYRQGDLEETRKFDTQSLAIRRELGDRRGEGLILGNLGYRGIYDGHIEEAQALIEESLAIYRELGNQPGAGWSYRRLAVFHLAQGQLEKAESYAQLALDIAHEYSGPQLEVLSLTSLGLVHVRTGELSRAAVELAHAAAHSEELGDLFVLGLIHCAWVQLHVAAARRAAAAGDPPANHLRDARASLARAEECGAHLNTLPDSEISREQARARLAIEEFERELGTVSQTN
jgi:predicted ATPase